MSIRISSATSSLTRLARPLSKPVLPCRKHIRSSASTAFRSSPKKTFAYSSIAATAFSASLALYLLSPDSIRLDGEAQPRRKMRRRELIPMSEVEQHNTPEDLWVVIGHEVWDMTQFLESHPGGGSPLIRGAGKDVSNIYLPLHPPGTIEGALENGSLSEDALIGKVDPSTIKKVERPDRKQGATLETAQSTDEEPMDLGLIIGMPDFTEAARRVLPAKAFNYYSAGGTDEVTLGLNRASYNQILFRPRTLIDVSTVDTSTEFLGHKFTLPIFICPCGMAKLSHPEGEKLFASAAGKCGIAQFISTNASAPLNDILSGATSPEQPFFMQLYVDRNRKKTEDLMEKIESSGHIKGYFVTVDAAAPGKREADERSRAEVEVASGISGGKIQSDAKGGGIGRSVGGFIDPSLNWGDLTWLRSRTKLPIAFKGIQTVEDAKKAYDLGADAIYLSNHGARALDGSPPALYTLLELNKFYPEVIKDKRCEVYLDGGVRRGTDVVKALCLGANGVGIGRPFMYALTMGEEGVIHGIEIIRDEIETTLRLLGVTKLSQLGPHLLNTRAIDPLLAEKPHFGPDEQSR